MACMYVNSLVIQNEGNIFFFHENKWTRVYFDRQSELKVLNNTKEHTLPAQHGQLHCHLIKWLRNGEEFSQLPTQQLHNTESLP